MFVGFGPVVNGIQCTINIVAILLVAIVAAVLSTGRAVPNAVDAIALLLILVMALQNARMSRKGALFGGADVVVRGHVFERVIELANVTAVVIPNPPGVLKVISTDGGYASSQISANLLEMPADRRARREALARLAAALGPRGIYVSEIPVGWAPGLNRATPMVAKRTMALSRADVVWSVCSFVVWLLLTLL